MYCIVYTRMYIQVTWAVNSQAVFLRTQNSYLPFVRPISMTLRGWYHLLHYTVQTSPFVTDISLKDRIFRILVVFVFTIILDTFI
jgi:hypothetical protein